MFLRSFTRRGADSSPASPDVRAARRSHRRRPVLEGLEGRQLLSLGARFQVDSPSQPPAFKSTTVSASNANGWSVVAWTEQPILSNGQPGAYQVRAQLYNASGAKVGPEVTAPSNLPGYAEYQPSVSMDPQNEYVISWTQTEPNNNTFILAQKFNSQGAEGSLVGVGVGTFYQYESSVAMDPQGGFVVAYTRDTNDNNPDVFAKDYYSNEVLRTTITVAGSSLAEFAPSIAMDFGGNFDIAYEVQNGSKDAVYLSRYSDVDSLLTHTEVTTGSASDMLPSVSMIDGGDVAVAYIEAAANNTYTVDATMYEDGIYAEPKVLIGQSGTGFEAPSVAMEQNGNGTFAVTYGDFVSNDPAMLYVGVVGPGNSLTKTYYLGSNELYASITSLPSDTGEFLVTYSAGTATANHVDGQIGTYN
jgi:hypothetical protein